MKKQVLGAVMAVWLLATPASAKMLDIQELTSEKGIKLWLVEDHTLPVIALSFSFKSGPERDAPQKQGLAQLLSNTLDEGAGDIKSKEFQGALRDNAIDLGFSSARDEFSGSVRTLVRHKDEAFRLLKLALTKPRFDAEAVERMRKANLSRIRSSMGDANWVASRLLYDRMYAGHPYALNAGGTLASMQGLSAGDLKAEWKRIASRDALVVGLTGDISKDDALKLVDAMFADIPTTSNLKPLDEAAMPKAGKPVFYKMDQPQTVMSLAWNGIGIHDPDYYAAVVMDYIFGGGGFSSRLMTEIREKRGLTYGVSSAMYNNRYANRYLVSASMLPQNVGPALALVKSLAEGLKTTDVGETELQNAKAYLTGSLPLTLSSSRRIAGTLVDLQVNERPATALDDYRAKIEAVTPADIKRVAARIFTDEPITVLVGAMPDNMDLEIVTTIPNTEGAPKK